jgi:hypothetical protein
MLGVQQRTFQRTLQRTSRIDPVSLATYVALAIFLVVLWTAVASAVLGRI